MKVRQNMKSWQQWSTGKYFLIVYFDSHLYPHKTSWISLSKNGYLNLFCSGTEWNKFGIPLHLGTLRTVLRRTVFIQKRSIRQKQFPKSFKDPQIFPQVLNYIALCHICLKSLQYVSHRKTYCIGVIYLRA